MKQKQVEVGDFVKLLDGSFGKYGVKKGDIIYLAGDAIVAVSEKDPYALRRIFLGARVEDGHIDIKTNPFTVDGKRLEAVSKAKQAELNAIRKTDFKEMDSGVDQSETVVAEEV